MRVCLISREYPPETGFGGIATFVRHLAHGLVELGHEVEVVCLATKIEKVVDDNGVKVHRVLPYDIEGKLDAVNRCMPYSRYVLLTTLALWRKFFELHQLKPFDVAESPELLAESIYVSVLNILPLVIRLYTPHSKFIAENLNNAAVTFDHLFVASLERVAMAGACALTSPSEDLANFVASDLNYPREKIEIIHNPIDPIEFSPDGHCALEKDGKDTILFVGRLEERKGIQYLIDAVPQVIKHCPKTKFVIIGDDTINATGGHRSVLKDLRDSLASTHCTNNVVFIPRIPLLELPAYYRSADICVVPSLYDNSPYTCLEAMSCGRPVVGTAAGGTSEYVLHGETGLIVPPKDSQALAEALISLLKDKAYRDKLGTNARKRVLNNFQRKIIAEKTVKLYQLAIERFQNKKNSLYLRSPEQALPDAAVMLYCFDRMIYNLIYQESLSFRLSYWRHAFLHRPRLFIAKACFRVVDALSKLISKRPEKQPKFLTWLKKEIESKQKDHLAQVPSQATAGQDPQK